MNILLTDGDNRATLALTRALGPAHRVIVGSVRERSLASVSRFCHAGFAYPDPIHDQAGFVATLEQIVRRHSIDILVPITDITTFVVARNRHRFEPACRLPIPSLDILAKAADKAGVVRAAIDLGIPAPRTRFVEYREAAPRFPNDAFPLVVKPARSRVQVGHVWLATSVSYAFDHADLTRVLAALPDAAFPVLLQERIAGEGMGVFACYDRGRCIALFSHRRLREKPPSGGVSVLRESAPLDPVAAGYATRLLDHIGWHGVAMVEFKRDERDGAPQIMEINGRFWGSLQLAIDAGCDFPGLLLRIGEGAHVAPVPPYRVGVRSRWLLGDFDALLMLLFKRSEREKLPPDRRSRSKALREFFNFSDPQTRLEILRRDDVRPWLLEALRWFRPDS